MTSAGTSEEQLKALLDEYGGWLRATVRRLCPRDMGIVPEDVEQEVRVRLWKTLESGRIVEHPPSFLYRVASTVTIDAMRAVRSRRRVERAPSNEATEEEELLERRPAAEPSPESRSQRRQMLEDAGRLIQDLPEARRRAVGLYLQGFKIQEIADLAGWSEPKARNLLYRGLAVLREKLTETGHHHGDI